MRIVVLVLAVLVAIAAIVLAWCGVMFLPAPDGGGERAAGVSFLHFALGLAAGDVALWLLWRFL